MSKIEEIKKNNTFKITSNKKILLLEKNENKDKLSLYEQQNNNNKTLIFEFNFEKIESHSDTFFITEIRPQSIEDSIIFYQKRIEREYKNIHLPKLLHKLIANCYHNYCNPHPHYDTRNVLENYSLLANNSKFLSHVDKIKQDFDSQYNLFKSMQNPIL